MDLPRAEIRYHGLRAVAAAVIRRLDRIGSWVRPRAAPLAITALATLCMLAGLDLIAHDFRKLRDQPEARKPLTLYLTSVQGEVYAVELLAEDDLPNAPSAPSGPKTICK
jgi:hypothetical protein